MHISLKKNKIAQQNHTKNITKKPFHCDSYILKIITRHSLINTHLRIHIYTGIDVPQVCVNIHDCIIAHSKNTSRKNSFYLCNYARVSERSARRDFLSFLKELHIKKCIHIFTCVY